MLVEINPILTDDNDLEHSEIPLAELVQMTTPFRCSQEEERSDCHGRFTDPEAVLIPNAELL